jgi:hypothetical protein
VEQGIDRWIGTGWLQLGDIVDPEKIYITDGSYVKVSQATYPGKVFWASGDHSAVTTSQSGVFISKWNEYPLVEHAWNYSPYGSSDLNYYRSTTSITGPSSICPTGTYTLSTGQPATWSVSPYYEFSITPTNNGTSATVTATYAVSTGKTGTVTAVVGSVTLTKSIQACKRAIVGTDIICATGSYSLNTGESANWSVSDTKSFSISSMSVSPTTTVTALTGNASGMVISFLDGQYLDYSITSCSVLPPVIPPVTLSVLQGPDYISSCASATTYTLSERQATNWAVSSTDIFTIVSSNATSATIKVNNPSSDGEKGAIVALIDNLVIAKPITTRACSASASALAFPNPASSEVTFEITDDANNEVPESSFNVNIVDINGTVVYSGQKKGKKFNLSTASFRNGVYNVIVSDGTISLQKKLVIKH